MARASSEKLQIGHYRKLTAAIFRRRASSRHGIISSDRDCDGPSRTNRLSMARQSRIQVYDQPRTRRADFGVGVLARSPPTQNHVTRRPCRIRLVVF